LFLVKEKAKPLHTENIKHIELRAVCVRAQANAFRTNTNNSSFTTESSAC